MNLRIHDEFMSTGAVIAGRPTFEPAGGWGGDHHDGVPIYIVSRHPAPEWTAGWPGVHYIGDLAEAFASAKRDAGGKNVMVHGAALAQRAIVAGLLDELEVHLIPVLMGDGIRLFEHLGIGQRRARTCPRARGRRRRGAPALPGNSSRLSLSAGSARPWILMVRIADRHRFLWPTYCFESSRYDFVKKPGWPRAP